MMGNVDTDHSGTVSQDEWLAYIKRIFDKNEKSAVQMLKLYEKQIGQNRTMKLQSETTGPATDAWSLRSEAIRVFDLADKDHNGCLDMAELANVRNSPEFAQAMMGNVDTDHSGTVSQD